MGTKEPKQLANPCQRPTFLRGYRHVSVHQPCYTRAARALHQPRCTQDFSVPLMFQIGEQAFFTRRVPEGSDTGLIICNLALLGLPDLSPYKLKPQYLSESGARTAANTSAVTSCWQRPPSLGFDAVQDVLVHLHLEKAKGGKPALCVTQLQSQLSGVRERFSCGACGARFRKPA